MLVVFLLLFYFIIVRTICVVSAVYTSCATATVAVLVTMILVVLHQ